MNKARVLFVASEIEPYLKESPIATMGRYLPQGIQEKGKDIRTFMPRYGLINERRNQLHEVIRLSGMNLIINDTDHPLIIKVASIQQARMQIYFIDNDDYFQRKYMLTDKNGKFYKDNDERAIFFARGTIETVKKLGWSPDLIHCHGWFAAMTPLFIKRAFRDNPLFSNTKIVTSIYNDAFDAKFNRDFGAKVKMAGITEKDLKHYKKGTYVSTMCGAIDYSDGVIIATDNLDPEIAAFIEETKVPVLPLQARENYVEAYNNFYDQILGDVSA